MLVLVASLLFGSLLNAEGLARSASSLPPGPQRTMMMAVTESLHDTSRSLGLDVPRRTIETTLGRASPASTIPLPPPSTAPVSPTTPSPTVPPATTTATPPETPAPTAPATTTATPPETPAPTAPATTNPPPTTIPGVFPPTAEKPARLWVTGDSLTEAFGPALINLMSESSVVEADREVQYSTGLTRPDYFDWPNYLGSRLEAQPTDILVFMIGANDGQPIHVDGDWVAFGTATWEAEYRRRVAKTMAVVSDRVATTYWVGQPVARSSSYSHKMKVMNRIYREKAAHHHNVSYVDSWQVFLDDSGQYSAYLADSSGRTALMRRTDGIHLTADGGMHLARVVHEIIEQDWVPE